jgi:hypothetical protein
MINTIKQILEEAGKELVESVQEQMKADKKNASGGTSSRIRYEIREDKPNVYTLEVLGDEYIFNLMFGRGKTKNNGKGVLVERIKDWIINKGLTVDDLDSASWAIATSIHKKGTNRKYWKPKLLVDSLKRFNSSRFLSNLAKFGASTQSI